MVAVITSFYYFQFPTLKEKKHCGELHNYLQLAESTELESIKSAKEISLTVIFYYPFALGLSHWRPYHRHCHSQSCQWTARTFSAF